MTQLTKVTSHKLVHSTTSDDNDDDIDNRDFGNDNDDDVNDNYLLC